MYIYNLYIYICIYIYVQGCNHCAAAILLRPTQLYPPGAASLVGVGKQNSFVFLVTGKLMGFGRNTEGGLGLVTPTGSGSCPCVASTFTCHLSNQCVSFSLSLSLSLSLFLSRFRSRSLLLSLSLTLPPPPPLPCSSSLSLLLSLALARFRSCSRSLSLALARSRLLAPARARSLAAFLSPLPSLLLPLFVSFTFCPSVFLTFCLFPFCSLFRSCSFFFPPLLSLVLWGGYDE